MTIGIYNPYLDTLGGGEQYLLMLASRLSKSNTVKVYWDSPLVLKQAEKRFSIDLSRVELSPDVWSHGGFFSKRAESKQLDVLIMVSDGSIPLSFAKKTILIFQFPVNWVSRFSIANRVKLKNIHAIICYSAFVKKFIDRTFGVNASVVPPGIDRSLFIPGKKTKTIVSVGRFTRAMNTKKQEVLIKAFTLLSKKEVQGWRLVLAGGALMKDLQYVDQLRKKARGYAISVIPNIAFPKLQALYSQASIYWHAAGYGEDLILYPERAEHFGITTVEAMCAGAVPVVYRGGGQEEIVSDGEDGFLWKSTEELLERTSHLIKKQDVFDDMSKAAIEKSKQYSMDIFYDQFKTLIK